MKHEMLAIKHYPDEWNKMCVFTKKDVMETFKGDVNPFDILK